MSGFFKYAAVAAAAAVILLAIVLVPNNLWDAATVVSLLLLALSVAISLAAPSFITGSGNSEVGRLSTIGISGFVLVAFFVLSLASFILAATGTTRTVVWAAIIVSAACLAIGSFITRGSVAYLDTAFPDRNDTNKTSRSKIMAELSIIKSTCPAQFTGDIDRLLEKLRFSASDLSDVASNENGEIFDLLTGDLKLSCRNNDPTLFQRSVLELDEKISTREFNLKAARSKV